MSRDTSNTMDISATLDELLKDDEMFNELQDLPLNVGTQAGQCESQDLSSFDLSFLFSDLNGDISEGMWSTEPSDLGTHHGTSSEYIQLTPQSDSVSRESKPQQTTSSDAYNYFNQWVGEEAQNVCTRAGTTSSVSETTPEQQRPEVTTLAAVRHDHSYAKLPCSEEEEKDVMEVEEGSDSAEDSSSNHDAGYETMSASMSPDSKSSPPPPLSSASLSLLPDPVKLIDERIKYFMSTQQVSLSAEEKETLIAEGLPVPTTLPLTKIEEKALKSVRRKIRNKVAAQESRKKKKEYIDSLEERVKRCSEQNHQLQRKVDNLETENRTLLQQLQQLQALVARTNPIFRPMQLGSCLMVVVLCFAILFGNMLPYKVTLSSSTEYTSTATVRSRALLSLDTPHYHGWIDYYKSLLLGDDTPWSMLGSNSMVDQSDEYSKTELDTNKTNEPHPQLITAR